jgi:transposase
MYDLAPTTNPASRDPEHARNDPHVSPKAASGPARSAAQICHPGQKLYLIADNFSPHKHPRVMRWTGANDVELVFLPTYASWLNWIESEFAAVRYFALHGTDHRTHAEQGDAIAGYMRRRNARAQPKHDFAADSVIRTWTDYKINVA